MNYFQIKDISYGFKDFKIINKSNFSVINVKLTKYDSNILQKYS